MKIEPYLWGFNGRCEEAIEFYKKALGAEVQMLMRFGESPEKCEGGSTPPDNNIMHSSIKIGDSVLMLSDGQCNEDVGTSKFTGMSLSLNPASEADAQKIFGSLSDGGQVMMPLGKTFWSPCFGMVTDRFGVAWMINVLP
ncbi:VOC family protein [Haloferula sp. BvORR071]|uniref:VOC family protein n=1 Tax=Haloferula sp. BvORR071 TaxID=1396141 RepID=UPI00054DC104|nr:VOC family protein [Haloferula sp. BvORR071]